MLNVSHSRNESKMRLERGVVPRHGEPDLDPSIRIRVNDESEIHVCEHFCSVLDWQIIFQKRV
jgi:hypothetical protein